MDCDADLGDHPISNVSKNSIVDYLVNKYGQDHVAHVGNRLVYSSKSAIRDLGQIYDIPSSETLKCTKFYNDEMNVSQNMKKSKEIYEYFNKHPELVELVEKFNGVTSALGIHAGGVIISDKKYPLKRWVGLQRTNEDGRLATSWTKEEVAKAGFIKIDILGLKCASQIHVCKELRGEDPYKQYEFNIPEVFQNTVLRCQNKNIFQFESHLGKKAFQQFMPMSIDELANASGLIRVLGTEGGRDAWNKYAENIKDLHTNPHRSIPLWKEKLEEEVHDFGSRKICEDILGPTYGILIYQEQLSHLIEKLSRGERTFVDGNNVRKFLGRLAKKHGYLDSIQGDEILLKKWHDDFMKIMNEYLIPYIPKDSSECPDKKVRDFLSFNLQTVGKEKHLVIPEGGIINWMVTSSLYIFSRLHSIAYSVNTYEQLYQKYYDSHNFWLSACICSHDNLNKLKDYISAIMAETKINILPPDVNKSDFFFKKEDNDLRFGLGSIMSLGKSAKAIIGERDKKGKFKSLEDFFNRCSKFANIAVMRNLIYTNAFGDLGTQEEAWEKLILIRKKEEFDNSRDNLSKKEYKFLGINITYLDPIVKKAKEYLALQDLEDRQTEKLCIRIIKKLKKKTKTGKDYFMYRTIDLNSQQEFNLFDWEGKNLEDQKTYICKVYKNGDFYSISKF